MQCDGNRKKLLLIAISRVFKMTKKAKSKEKKAVVSKMFRRDDVPDRPHSSSPTSGLRDRGGEAARQQMSSPPKLRQREISWVDYEQLIKARQDERYSSSPESRSRNTSRAPSRGPASRGRSPAGARLKRGLDIEDQEEEDDADESMTKHHVRFSISLPVRPKESLPFPFLRRQSQSSFTGERRRSNFGSEVIPGEKCFEGELHIDNGRSIVATPRVPGDQEWRDATKEPPSITQKLAIEGLAMQVPQYLADMRGESRRSSLRAFSTFGPLITSHRRSAFVRSVIAATNIDGAAGARDRRTSKYITIAPKARLSTVIVPVNAKQWLLQTMCLRDAELRELCDQMELVPQLASDHVREVRAQWDALAARQMKVPPEAETLVKDKVLLDKVKILLSHFIELSGTKCPEEELLEEQNRQSSVEASMEGDVVTRKEISPVKDSSQNAPFRGRKHSRSRSPSMMFQGFERDREGSLSPVFGMGASLCALCGQVQPRGFGKDGQTPIPASKLPRGALVDQMANPRQYIQLLGSTGELRRSLSALSEKRYYSVLFPALQPANKENVQLLGEWLKHAIIQNRCEMPDGQFADVDSAFLLYSIAFLEIVRQVRLQCEERGDMLLHVWRQLLRIFSQVMIRVEPKLLLMEKDTLQLKERIYLDNQKIGKTSEELAATIQNLEATELQLKEKELQWSQLKRCHLCAGEDLAQDSHHLHKKGFAKWEAGGDVEGGQADGSLGTPASEMSQKGHGHKDQKSKGKGHGQEKVSDSAEEASGSIDGGLQRGEEGATPTGPGEDIDEHSVDEEEAGKVEDIDPDAYKPGKISEGFLHADKLLADVGVQTDPDIAGRGLFFEILKRPVSAPGRLMTAIIEEFQLASGVVHRDLAEGEQEVVKKEPVVTGLSAEDIAMLDATDDMAEEDNFAKINKSALKMLANDSLEVLDHLAGEDMDDEMAEKLNHLFGKFTRLQRSGSVHADGEEDEGPDYEGSSKKKKNKGWAKLRTRLEEANQRREMFVSIAAELMMRQKNSKAKVTKPKDLPNVPLGFSKMMKINPPPKNIKQFTEHQLIKLVEAIYEKKIEADSVDDAQGNERQNACEFMYDFMLNSYGLKGLAESAVHGVFKKIKQMMISKGIEKTHKLRLFQRFCGFDPLRGYAEQDLYLYLKCLSRAQDRVGVFFPAEGDSASSFINAGQMDILLEEPTLLSQFKGSKEVAADFIAQFAAANSTVEKVTPEVQKIVKSTTVKKLDFDLLMEAIIEVAPHKESKKPTKPKAAPKAAAAMSKEDSMDLENLFKAGDANQDGVLTFNEFREIIRCADASVSETNALRMFRETLLLMPDGGDNISPSAFASVAHSHDIRATPAVVYDLLKKTWLQIQDDVNEEQLGAEKAKKKECDEMRAVLRDMLKERKVSDVNRAVQTFQSFVLKFCGKTEETPPANSEPQEEDGT